MTDIALFLIAVNLSAISYWLSQINDKLNK